MTRMPNDDEGIRVEVRKILDTFVFTPFDECYSLSREFSNIPSRPGIYAVKHKYEGLLYIGKTKSLRGRFSSGNKAFLWAWLDKYNDEDVRITIHPIPYWRSATLLSELEAIILRATEPPYNVQIPMES
ncbi:MAG: GIY-YIG nuclease family protein [Chroococcidiopsidaceae cyanobacterium CP_BM_RX_35]|nr:GIY-YIG nuclease family protein [Chroococcidiopsidaceae cyanobacterium CP_BM_RX_35]